MLWRFAVALICAASAGIAEPRAVLTHSVDLEETLQDFAGLSAIEVFDGGDGAFVVSDRGQFFRIMFDRSGDLAVQNVNRILRFSVRDRDTEGLALRRDGRIFASYEGPAEVKLLEDNRDHAVLPPHPDFADLQPNASFEALAIDANGALYTLPERSGSEDKPFPIYIFADGVWTRGPEIARSEGFLAVGADFGPDGLFYLLERGVGLLGFRTRVRRFDLGAPDLAQETILAPRMGTHGNLEGISVWRDASGATHLTMVADDNFLALQSSEIVEYTLTE